MKLRNPTRALVAVSALASVFTLTSCQKADNASSSNDGDTVKIGFITDMSGVYADVDGPAGAEAIKMAIADFGDKVNGKKIEFVSADHQNKADIAASKAREWFERFPKAAYMTEIEFWRELDDGVIEFTIRRLPTAD